MRGLGLRLRARSALVVAVLLVGDRRADDVRGRGAGDADRRRGHQDGHADDRRGPVAALVAIKQLGTNGGGFFGPNSTHPFENPTPWSNLLEVVAIVMLPMASIVMFGLMLKNRAARGGDLRRDAGLPGGRRRRGRSGPRSSRAPRPTGLPVAPGAEHGGQGGPARPGRLGDLGGDHDGHVERLGQQHARQPQPARRAWCRCRS